jgi:hypothetical protein
MKLPAQRAGLPGKEVSFMLCPLTPPTRRGLQGTLRPIARKGKRSSGKVLIPLNSGFGALPSSGHKTIDLINHMRYNNKKCDTEEKDNASKFENPFGKR